VQLANKIINKKIGGIVAIIRLNMILCFCSTKKIM